MKLTKTEIEKVRSVAIKIYKGKDVSAKEILKHLKENDEMLDCSGNIDLTRKIVAAMRAW